MPAVVTDQFRILNASNFVDTVTGIGGTDPSSSFYVSVSLPNPTVVGFGRTSTWDTATPNPVDNINNVNHIDMKCIVMITVYLHHLQSHSHLVCMMQDTM